MERKKLHRNAWITAIVAAFALGLFLQACACGGGEEEKPKEEVKKEEPKEEKEEDNTCPKRGKDLKDLDKKTTCTCPKDAPGGSVWGNKIYTTDSNICAAAAHAGVIKKKKGGEITVKGAKGCDSYEGKEKNGVTSSKWGKYKNSFYFPDKHDGKCAKGGGDGKDCPARFKDIAGFKTDAELELKCKCKEGKGMGSVYGTKVYTNDSSICKAAIHAGVIDDKGGKVKVKSFKGCKKYKKSKKNGVKTSKWGKYDSSFYFPKAGDPKCD